MLNQQNKTKSGQKKSIWVFLTLSLCLSSNCLLLQLRQHLLPRQLRPRSCQEHRRPGRDHRKGGKGTEEERDRSDGQILH